MKQHLLKNTYAAIVALFIAMMALPTTAQAQSIAKQALKSSSGEMPITGNKIKMASAKASVSFPLLEDFESGEIPDGWTLIDADNDGRNWRILSNETYDFVIPKSGKCVICSYSAGYEDINADNYLISPKISGATQLIYWFAMNPKCPDDRYQVLASTTGKDISDFTIVLKDEKPTDLKPIEGCAYQSEWIKRTLQLPVGTKYIAFRHYDSNKSGKGNYIFLDDITIDGKIINYALDIAGTQVTSANCDDLSEIDGVEGTVKYDPDNKTLTLEGAKLNVEGDNFCIWSKIDGLTIKVSGTNELNAKNAAISVHAPTTITGGGTLNAKSPSDCVIYAGRTNLTIKDCIVNVKGNYGIAGYDGSKEKLLISNATVTAEGRAGSICDFKEITLEDCAITQPTGATFDESKHAIVLNGKKVTSEVKIEPITKYDLKICGTQVTSGNCGDLSEIDGVEGTVKYDPDTKILRLENAKLNNAEKGNCIFSGITGLTIEVIGTNEVSSIYSAGVAIYSPTTITGGGTLNSNSRDGSGIYIGVNDLTINNCIVNAMGQWGIAGENGSNEKLLIRNATVTAEGEQGSICDLASLTLEYCNITQPAGAKFDESQKAVVLNGEVVTSKIVIARDPAGIDTPTIDTAAKQGIYTLSGVKLNGEAKDLPKGIYIVNGKKVVKK